MKHTKDKKRSKHEKKKLKKKSHKKERKYSESSSSSSISQDEQEWVEKSAPSTSIEQSSSTASKEQETQKREDWMNIKSIFPCIFNEKKSSNTNKNADKPDLDTMGQSARELNPYWKNGGDGLPGTGSTIDSEQVLDVKWLKKSLRRAKEQAESEGRSLDEIAAERWGSLEVIQSMISKAEKSSGNKVGNTSDYRKYKFDKHSKNTERREINRQSYQHTESRRDDSFGSNNRDRYQKSGKYSRHKQEEYKKPVDDNYFPKYSRTTQNSGSKRWQKEKVSNEKEESRSNVNKSELETTVQDNSNAENTESKEVTSLTEAEMNKLGARIVKAEIMGDNELAAELKLQLKKARELGAKAVQSGGLEEVQNVILTQTDIKGFARPLEPRSQSESSGSTAKRKNQQTHVSGKRVCHYYDDDKYSLQQLFQREKGRSAYEDDAAFVKIASKNMDMDDIFEEQITKIQSDAKQDNKDRSLAIKQHKKLFKSLDTCRWCIDSKYMLKHMIATMDSEICLSLPSYASLTVGHCILTPTQHIACQLQLDENVWQRLKVYKQALYKMFMDQNRYPVFYEIYKSRHKFPHMQLECVPLPKEIGESAPMYFKKALLECETEWSMNKKIVNLEHKDVRQTIPNGLSYFMVEFETNKGYAHVIEDEQMFPKNFAEEIIGGMLDLDHDVWRKPKKDNFDQQREKVLNFSEVWKKYESEVTGSV